MNHTSVFDTKHLHDSKRSYSLYFGHLLLNVQQVNFLLEPDICKA